MWRSVLRRKATLPISRIRSRIRRFSTRPQNDFQDELPRVRIIGPTIWCITTAGLIYLGCAAYEVRQDAKHVQNVARLGGHHKDYYNEFKFVDEAGRQIRNDLMRRDHGLFIPDFSNFKEQWKSMSGTSQMIETTVGLNLALYSMSRFIPGVQSHLWHIPAAGPSYTLLTSMFGHAGLLHLGFNLYALINFGQPVARSNTIAGSGSHLTAFYLSSGLIASLSQHVLSTWGSPVQRVIPSLGASGGIMAIISLFALSYPEAQIGIIFVPISVAASQGLAALLAFEMYGTFWRNVGRLGHGAHLGGLVAGMAYVHFDGAENLWRPTRRFVYNQMRRMNML